MFGSLAKLRCCDAYLRSAVTSVNRRSAWAPKEQPVESSRRVLVVEFRDEVFAELKSVFEEHGCEVARAASGASVAAQVKQFAPGLLLVNESMPDESGWLITCKLRLTRQRLPIWLYAVRKPHPFADWKESIGVDEILAYGGVVSRLRLRVRERLERWLRVSAEYLPGAEAWPTATAAAAAKCA